MKKHSWTLIALVIGMAVSTQVGAQTLSEHQQDHTQTSKTDPVKSMRASQLLGINVTAKSGESLGQVQDIIFDAQTGKLEFALIGKGFMAGLGERMIPLPWEAINVRSQKEFAVSVDPQKLQSAPAWSQAEMEQPDYIIRIYRFYELEPQAEMGGPGLGGQQSGSGSGSSSDQFQSQDEDQDPGNELKSSHQDHQIQPNDSAPEPDK